MTRLHQTWWPVLAIAALGASTAIAAPKSADVPKGWIITGDRSDLYAVSVERDVRHRGPASAHLYARKEKVDGFGSLMQTVDAKRYRGQRMRLSGWVKSSLANEQWAGLWMRVDGPGAAKNTLGFDNMHSRPIVGERDWTRYAVVLDVPDDAVRIAFGALVVGAGEIWVDELSFERVGDDVPTTQPVTRRRFEPVNLDFEEGRP